MRAVLVFLSVWCGAAWAQGALTLQEAWRLAEQGNAGLLAAQAGLAATEGALKDSSALLYNNPEPPSSARGESPAARGLRFAHVRVRHRVESGLRDRRTGGPSEEGGASTARAAQP